MNPSLAEVDLNLLHTFRVFVEAGGVAEAARRLSRTPAAVSVRLARLQRELGVKLLEKLGRRLELTAAGKAIHDDVGALMGGVKQLLDRVRATSQEPWGTLRVGALPTVSAYLLAPAVAAFLARHALARVEIRPGLTGALVAALLTGDLDVVVSIGPLPRGRLSVTPLGAVRPVAALPAANAPRGTLGVDRLRALGIVGYAEVDDVFFAAVERFVARHRLSPQVRCRVRHIQTVKELVRAGAGAGILPDYTVVEPGLVTRRISGLDLRLPIWIATRPAALEIPLVARFRERVLAG